MDAADAFEKLRAAFEAFDRGTPAAILKGGAVAGNLALRELVGGGGAGLILGSKDSPVDATRITSRTGNLRRAYSATEPRISGNTLTYGLQLDSEAAPYGPIVEFGGSTGPHEIRPVRKLALHWQEGGIDRFARVVQHPGSHFPPRPAMQPSLAATQDKALEAIEDQIMQLAAATVGAVA